MDQATATIDPTTETPQEAPQAPQEPTPPAEPTGAPNPNPQPPAEPTTPPGSGTDETKIPPPGQAPKVASFRDRLQARTDRPTDTKRDEILLSIEGQEVVVAKVDIDFSHQGKFRQYALTTVTLDDGRSFTVSGRSIAEPMAYLEESDFPVRGTFNRQPSDFDKGGYYWTFD